jgi:hypothetical protein
MQLQSLLLRLYKRLQQLRVYFEASGKKQDLGFFSIFCSSICPTILSHHKLK